MGIGERKRDNVSQSFKLLVFPIQALLSSATFPTLSTNTSPSASHIVVHERPQLVLNFLLQESNLGVFRRQILEVENTPQRRMTVFWQHYLKGGRTIIEYLLELTISQDSSSFIVEIKSLKEKDLHKHVRVKLKNFLTANENSVGQRALIEGELRFGGEDGQNEALCCSVNLAPPLPPPPSLLHLLFVSHPSSHCSSHFL